MNRFVWVMAGLLAGAAAGSGVQAATQPSSTRVSMPPVQAVDGVALNLLGTGVRSRPGGRVDYVLGLYVADGCMSAQQLLTSQEPKSARVVFVDGMSFERGRKVLVEDMIINLEPQEFEGIAQQLGQLLSIGPVDSGFPPGSWIAFNYLPGRGTVFVYNGQQSQPIAGDALYQALLKQWLGPRPISREFKRSVLGACAAS